MSGGKLGNESMAKLKTVHTWKDSNEDQTHDLERQKEKKRDDKEKCFPRTLKYHHHARYQRFNSTRSRRTSPPFLSKAVNGAPHNHEAFSDKRWFINK